jgi:CheY-like chemotaxis protein
VYAILSYHDPVETHRLVTDLLRLGCKISLISNPYRLIAAVEESRPDLLFVGFPAVDEKALHVMHELRQHPSTAALPLVVISPAANADSHFQAFAAVCDDILRTPVSHADIEALLSKFQDGD